MFFSVITKNSVWEILTKNLVTFKDKIRLRIKNFNIFRVHWKTQYYQIFTRHFKNLLDIISSNPVNWYDIYEKLLRIMSKPKDVATYWKSWSNQLIFYILSEE